MGFDLNSLGNLSGVAGDLLKNSNISIGNLFTADFMSKFTNFSNIGDFLKNAGINVDLKEGLGSLPLDKLVDFIPKNTKFGNWTEMLSTAMQFFGQNK